MDDSTYRTMLREVAGVASSKELDRAGVDKVMAHLVRCGFQPKAAPKHGKRPNAPKSRQPLIDKIEAQLTAAGRPWAYADALAKRICKVEKIAWCNYPQLQKIIAALNYDAKRNGRDYAG
jgi:phage gp16-like protein